MNKFIILGWIPRITALFSIVGSSAIVYMVISDGERKLTKPSHRFLLLMSIFDIMQSTAGAFTSMAIPRNPDYPGSMGNETTCTIQGFFLALGLAVPLYNSSLNLFFLLSIRYNIDPKIFSRKVEPYLHAFSILVPLMFSITFAATGKMQPRETVCAPTSKEGQIFLSIVVGCCILFCLYSMGQICWTVISQNRSTDKYVFKRMDNQNSSTRSNRALMSNDRETVKQALMYSSAFILTYTFPLVGGMIWKGGTGNPIPYWISILSNIFYPLQGFWNFLFYIRPGIDYVLQTTDKSLIGAVLEVVFNGKGLSMQRTRSQTSVSKKNPSCRWPPTHAAWQDKRNTTSTSKCHNCISKVDTEIKQTITEGILIDVETGHSQPEGIILQESIRKFAVQDEQSGESKDFLHNDNREEHIQSLDLESCANNVHKSNVNNDVLDDTSQKAEIQSGRKEQQRRSSFVTLASVLCETDLDSLVSSSYDCSDQVHANKSQQRKKQRRRSLPIIFPTLTPHNEI